MFYCDYPIIGAEQELPIYLINMGLHHCQERIVRNEGYPCCQLLYCTKGSGTLIINRETYIIGPYTAIFLPANYPHEYFPNEDIWDIHWIVPGGAYLSTLLEHFHLTTASVFKLYESHRLESLFRAMHEDLRSDALYGNYKASGHLYEFLLEFNRIVSGKQVSTIRNSTVLKAVDYINWHFEESITLDDLCNLCGVTKQHLCHLFRSTLQMRPMEYVTKRRLQHCKELLIETTKTIDIIAEESGFCTASYFCKNFKRYEGITPTQFRETHLSYKMR